MKIKKLIIYGYGKWVDKSFDLSEGLQIFLGKNEAGKSTLMSFIHSILFGFPTRNSVLLRYEPLESSKYGGKIIVEDSQLGEVMIERVHGKVTGDVTVTLEDGSVGSDALLKKVLNDLDRDDYRNIFSFSLEDIEKVSRLNKNKLSRYLLNIGAHSTDYYLNLVDEFEKSAYDLYRPSGRIPPLNKELSTIKKEEKKLKRIESKNNSYLELINKRKKQNQELEKIEEKIAKKEKKLKELDQLKKDLHLFKEIYGLKKEIKETNLPYLKEDGLYLLEEKKRKIEEVNNELVKLRHQIQNIKSQLREKEKIDLYQENQKEIKKLEEKLPDKVEELERMKRIDKKQKENQERQKELKELLKVNKKNTKLIQLSEEDEKEIKEILKTYHQVNNKINHQEKKMTILENDINQKNEKADYYEEMMWEQEYFSTVEKKLAKREKPTTNEKNQRYKMPFFLISLFALFVILLSFFLSSTAKMLSRGVGSLVILFSSFYYLTRKKANKKQVTDNESSKLLAREYDKQLSIQKDWQQTLAEIDSIQEEYQDYKEKQKQTIQLKKDMHKKWRIVLNSLAIPPIHPIETAESILEKIEKINELILFSKELEKKKLALTNKIEKDFTLLEKVLDFPENLKVNEKISAFREYLKEINELVELEKTKIKNLSDAKEKEKECVNKKRFLKEEITHLIKGTGAKTIEDFKQLYEEKEILNKKESRVKFLLENTADFNIDKNLPSKEEILTQKEKSKGIIKDLTEESKRIIDERAKTKLAIHNLEEDGRYSEALQSFENQKTRIQRLVDEWITDKIAGSIIQSTLNQVTEERFKEIVEKINQYFSFLTDHNYSNILFKNEKLFVQDNKGRVINVKTLSRGTAEPLYVAIRLAYIVKMRDMIKLPVIMDDPFVNFDEDRKENIYELLKEIAKNTQIIYFTFDVRLEDTFKKEQLIDLKE